MKKLSIIFSSIVAIIIFALIMSYVFINSILGIILTNSFGTKTTVNNSIIRKNKLSFHEIYVENTPHTKNPYALKIKELKVAAPISTYFSKNIHIREIHLNNLAINVEFLPGQNRITNWDNIVSHIQNSSSGSKKSKRNSRIDRLSINNITIRVTDLNGNTKVTYVRNLTFTNLDTKNGDITSQIAKTIILKMIFNAKNLARFPLKMTNKTIKDFIENLPFGGRGNK